MDGLFTPLTPTAARFSTLLARHGQGVVFESGDAAWCFGPTSGPEFEGPAIHGDLGDSGVTVWLAEPEWRQVAAEVLDVPPEAMESCPEPFVRAALESVASDALAALERSTGLAAGVRGMELAPSRPVGRPVHFGMVNKRGLALRCAAVFTKADGQWAGAVEKALSGLPAQESPLPDDLPLPAEIHLARMRVAAAELKGLENGDVVLFPAGNGLTVLVCGRRRFAAEMGDGTIRVGGGEMSDSSTAGEAAGDPAETAEGRADIDSLEVEVTAQVGRMAMTLGQLRRLGAGQVVEFPTSVENPARLTVGGKVVATGELVDVGGRVGVRIVEMGE